MSDIFLSYAREDRTHAESLAKALSEKGWSVWWDRRLEAGEVWDEVIASNLESARIVLVLWTPTSIKSRWVKNEAQFADEKGKLVPVLIRSASIPLGYRHLQTEDLSAWRGDASDTAFLRLADTLARRLGVTKGDYEKPPTRPALPRIWLLSAVLLALAGLGGGFFVLTGGNQQIESGSDSVKAPKDASSPHQPMVESGSDSVKALKDEPSAHQRTIINQTESGSGSTKALKDDSGAHQRMVIAIPGDRTIAEWTPGCLYEVRAERQGNGAVRTCFGFDPNECFSAAGMMQRTVGDDKLKSGAPVFVSLSPARDRWAAGTLSAVTGDRYYVQLDTGLECAKGGKPGLWVGADGVIASEKAD